MANKKGIGYSPLTEKVYMGLQDEGKRLWVGSKTDITNQFLAVALEFFPKGTARDITTSKEIHIFCHIKKDKESIEKLIKHLTKISSKL